MYIKEKDLKNVSKKVSYVKKLNINALRSGTVRVNKQNKSNKENI